jgi:hypothetical protein
VKREVGAQKVDLVQVLVGKFPVFVLGFILMFALSSTGIFAPAQHYQGSYFDNSDKAMMTKDREGKPVSRLLNEKDLAALQAEAGKVQRQDQKAALARLIENKKLMSIDDDDTLRGVVNAKVMSKAANDVLVKAHRAVRHTAPKIAKFRDLIAWFFTFGLVGLGMQITMASIKQAGGQPLVVGSIVGVLKAVGSLIVVWLLVAETI